MHEHYSAHVMADYRNGKAGMIPHVFALADKAFHNMAVTGSSQSILVSGESGAGKTMTTRYLLQYLTCRDDANRSWIEKQVLDSTPIFEAFGNATTHRNDNSSRFGRFIILTYAAQHSDIGGSAPSCPHIGSARIETYLLEKSRAIRPARGERNFHVFHQLLAAFRDPARAAMPSADDSLLPPALRLSTDLRFTILGESDTSAAAAAADAAAAEPLVNIQTFGPQRII